MTESWPEDDAAALAAIWAEHRTGTLDRVTVLDRAAAALEEGGLDDALRLDARREAHTLLGSAAIFGLDDAATIARVLELRYETMPPSRDAGELRHLAVALRAALEQIR
ncbi:MAG: hypothetical protein NVS9B6_19300 [Candidatus Limnocylindrales bacterium]